MTEKALSNTTVKGFAEDFKNEQVMMLSSSIKPGLWPAGAF